MAMELGLHAQLETVEKPKELDLLHHSTPEAFLNAWWALVIVDL